MAQTVKVELVVYVGMEKYAIEDTHVWSQTDDIEPDQMAILLVNHISNKMEAALNPCMFTHEMTIHNNEEA
jgi:hypothetical protein